jgi:hypothetical protein
MLARLQILSDYCEACEMFVKFHLKVGRLVAVRVWLAGTLVAAAGAAADAQQRPKSVAVPEALTASCRNVTGAPSFAECLTTVQRVIVENRWLDRMRFLENIYDDLVSTGFTFSCESALKNVEGDSQKIANTVKSPLGWQPRNCEDLAEVYQAVTGIPVRWTTCPVAPYSYEHFEACLVGALERKHEAEALARLYKGVTRNIEVDRPGFGFGAGPFPQASQQAAAGRQLRVQDVRREAQQCVAEGGDGFTIGLAGRYQNLAAARLPPGTRDRKREVDERFSKIKCPEAIRLAVRLNLLDAGALDAYAKARAAREQTVAAEAARKCSPQRAEMPPSQEDLTDALQAFVLENCATLPTALQALLGGAGPAAVGVGTATTSFKRGSHACTMTNFALKVEMAWQEVSRHSCARTVDGTYTCNVTGRMSCNSDDTNRLRNDVFCSIYAREQQGSVRAVFDRQACTWKVTPKS